MKNTQSQNPDTLPEEICSRIVTVGISPESRGGMASVIGEMAKMMKPFNFVMVQRKGWTKYVLPITAFFKSFRYIGKKYRIVHVHAATGSDFYRSSLFVLLFKLMGKKVILHMHSGKFEAFYGDGKKYVRYICRKCDAMATVSNYFVNMLKDRDLNDKVMLLHNVLPRPVVENLGKRNDTDRNVRLLFLGLICDKKGIFAVLDAIAGSRELRAKNVRLKIGGNGEVDRLMAEIKAKKLEDYVEFCGWVGPDDKDRLLRESDVYIMPSQFESFGISTLEAMGYRLPVIVSGVGGVPDLVTDGYNGLLVEPDNVTQIRQAILRLVNNPDERHRMGEMSAIHADDFSREKIVKQLTGIYESLLRTN